MNRYVMDQDEPIRIGSTTVYPFNIRCSKRGCKKKATGWKPLLGLGYCEDHFPIDRSGPDDFDIPEE